MNRVYALILITTVLSVVSGCIDKGAVERAGLSHYRIYVDDVTRGFNKPAIQFQVINNSDITIYRAYIKYNTISVYTRRISANKTITIDFPGGLLPGQSASAYAYRLRDTGVSSPRLYRVDNKSGTALYCLPGHGVYRSFFSYVSRYFTTDLYKQANANVNREPVFSHQRQDGPAPEKFQYPEYANGSWKQ